MRQLETDLYTDLTERQEQVLSYIEDRILDGLPPTRLELCAHFGWRSTQAAEEHLHALVRKGRITLLPAVSRGIKLVRA